MVNFLRETCISELVLLLASSVALAVERFPPPDFTNYELPATQITLPRSFLVEYGVVATLLVALSLASYLAIFRRWRVGLFVLAVASLFWFGFWQHGCVCSIGAIQNVTLALADPTYPIPMWIVAVFMLPLVFALFFGRTFCGSVCPLGAIQEIVVFRPVRVPGWLEHALGLIPYVYLGAAILFAATGTAFVICRYDPFVAIFRISGTFEMLVLGAGVLLLAAFVGRPYCRYVCPYGAILGLLSKVAKWKTEVTKEECIQCRLCENACPYGALHPPTVKLSHTERPNARRRLAVLILFLPILIALGAVVGNQLGRPMSLVDPTVQLAKRIQLESAGTVEGTADESDAFRRGEQSAESLYVDATKSREKFSFLGGWLGGWVGFVVGAKLIHLSIRRRRQHWQTNPATCVACGRCFWYCPNDRKSDVIERDDKLLNDKR